MIFSRSSSSHPHLKPFLLAALLLVLAGAGCLQPAEIPEGEADPLSAAESETGNATLPDPQIFSGRAMVANPAHFAGCLRNGLDGDLHPLKGDPGGWRFTVEPKDAFVVYWFNEASEYLGGGDGEGEVPEDAAAAEVCHAHGTTPADYTLELVHPEHETH